MRGINMLGMLDMKGNETLRRVYGIDGIAPTLTTCGGGNTQAKILVGGEMIIDDTQGFDGVRVYPDYSPTLRANRAGLKTVEGIGEMKKLKVNDLFCGAGGMGLGFKQAGFETAGAWDFDKYAVQAYAHNVDKVVKEMSILDMGYEDLPQADVWTFGFPCQDLSIAGKQAGLFEGERSGLFFEVMRLLDETKENAPRKMPDIIMAENVKGLKPYLEVLEDEYDKRGYKMYYTLYNSKFWGLAQNRERYFVIGVHHSIEKEFKFPVQQEDYIPRLSTALEPEVDEKYYIDNLKAAKIIEQAKEKVELKTLHACITPDRVEKRQNGPRAKAEELESYTLTAQDRHGVIENQFRVRKLTPREYLRLQGFPESFEIVVSDSQSYKQAGNAVSVPVARAIAERIKMFLLSL